MHKFKVGDRVVYVNKESPMFGELYGKVFTIKMIKPLGNSAKVKEYSDLFSPGLKNLVPESVWNSSLYQAMKEIENQENE